MKTVDVDVIVLGSGFAGSLTALLLRRLGRTVALIDQGRHPRFAIGESSTPIANMVLRDLAVRYDLPRLLPLCKYGTWQATYSNLTCGIKRGFSYFAHQPHSRFEPSAEHHNELLVAASADDHHSDTQWLRADVDAFLCAEAAAAGAVVWEEATVSGLKRARAPFHWMLRCERGDDEPTVRGVLLVDATGEAGVVPRCLGIASAVNRMQTYSRAIFSHFVGVRQWNSIMNEIGGATRDHPFPCDHAAQHHLLDGAWLWMLRFAPQPLASSGHPMQKLCSAGLVLDTRKHPLDDTMTAEAEWQKWLNRYPSLAAMFAAAAPSEVPGRLVRTGRLQRRWNQLAGPDWVLLPHTAGFVDPLHSSGIAHSLCGVERLVDSIEQSWGAADLERRLQDYERTLHTELDLIDELVAVCFDSLGDFEIFTACSMLYFAAATTYEHQRAANVGAARPAFLCADNDGLRAAVRAAGEQLPNLSDKLPPRSASRFFDEIARLVGPFNRVGLCDRSAQNMYRYTVAPL